MNLRQLLYHQLHIGAKTDGRLTLLNIVLVWVIIAAVVIDQAQSKLQARVALAQEAAAR